MTKKYTIEAPSKRKYHRDGTLSKAEVMLIMILFHDSGYRCLKHFYLDFPVKPRWELVSSHTARRSAITNMVLSNKYTRPQMMSVSGHKTEKTFNDYIKLGLDEWADNIASSSKDGLF